MTDGPVRFLVTVSSDGVARMQRIYPAPPLRLTITIHGATTKEMATALADQIRAQRFPSKKPQ